MYLNNIAFYLNYIFALSYKELQLQSADRQLVCLSILFSAMIFIQILSAIKFIYQLSFCLPIGRQNYPYSPPLATDIKL